MAIDFLKELGAYAEMVPLRIRRRREIVVPWLGGDYKFPKNQAERALNDVRAQIGRRTISLSVIQADGEVYRAAFRYLHDAAARDELHWACESEPDAEYLAGVRALVVEGIETWEDFNTRFPKSPASSTPSKTRDLEKTLERLQCQVTDLVAGTAHLREELRITKEVLNERHGERLREIAEREPKGSRVRAIVAELEAGITIAKKEMLSLATRLPKDYRWESGRGSFVYAESFLRAAVGFTADEQRQLVNAIEQLAFNRLYPSLQSQRSKQELPHTPSRSMMSRASREIRFSWKQECSTVTFYWVWRRGDSRTGQSEA